MEARRHEHERRVRADGLVDPCLGETEVLERAHGLAFHNNAAFCNAAGNEIAAHGLCFRDVLARALPAGDNGNRFGVFFEIGERRVQPAGQREGDALPAHAAAEHDHSVRTRGRRCVPLPVNQAGAYGDDRKKAGICGNQKPLDPRAEDGGAKERRDLMEKDTDEKQRRAKKKRLIFLNLLYLLVHYFLQTCYSYL